METQNTQIPPEKKGKKVALVYREGNPLLSRLEKDLQDSVETIALSLDDKRAFEWEGKQAYMGELRNNYDLIFTDSTMEVKGENVISVYSFLEGKGNWLGRIKSVVQQCKEQGKEPVLYAYGLADHIMPFEGFRPRGEIEGLEEMIGSKKTDNLWLKGQNDKQEHYHNSDKSLYLAYLISDTLGIKAIPYQGKTITSDLSKVNVSQENAVVLIDHHVASHHEKGLESMEFDKVTVYPVCPCCINLQDSRAKLEKCGLKVEPSIVAADSCYSAVLEEIKKKINERFNVW